MKTRILSFNCKYDYTGSKGKATNTDSTRVVLGQHPGSTQAAPGQYSGSTRAVLGQHPGSNVSLQDQV